MANGPMDGLPDPTTAMLANVRYMRENGFSEADVKSEIAKWQPKIAAYSARERREVGTPMQAVGESLLGGTVNVARGLPGGELAYTLGRMGTQRLRGQPETFAESRQAVQRAGEEYARENPRASTTLQLLGGGLGLGRILGAADRALTPTIASVAGRRAAVGGSTAAAYRALDVTPEPGATTGERLASRATGTLMSAPIGAATAAVAPWVMASPNAGATAVRTLLAAGAGGYFGGAPGAMIGGAAAIRPDVTARASTRAVERVAGRLPQSVSDFMQSIGSRGIVNKEMQQMQDILTPFGGKVGAPSNVAAENIARTQQAREQANALFAKARADRRIVDNPEIREILDDPDVSAAFEMAKKIREAYGGRVPTVTELQDVLGPAAPTGFAAVGTAQSPAPTVREAIDAFRTRLGQTVTRREGTVAQQVAREGLERQGAMAEGFPITGERTVLPTGFQEMAPVAVTREVPDPELLHLTKRILQDTKDRAFNRDATVQLQEGLRIAPKLNRLRDILHQESKDYASADRAMRIARVAEQAFNIGFSSATPSAGAPTSAKSLAEKTVAAARAFVAEQPDDELMRVAERAASQGARAQFLQQLTSADLQAGTSGMLARPGMMASPEARQQRALALGEQARSLEDVLTQIRGNEPRASMRDRIIDAIVSRNIPMANQAAQRVAPRDFARGRQQQELIAEVLKNPESYQQTLQQYRRGIRTREGLTSVLGGLAASRTSGVTRRAPSQYDIVPE